MSLKRTVTYEAPTSNKRVAYERKSKQYAKRTYKSTPGLRKAVKEAMTKLAEKKAVVASAANVSLAAATGGIPVSLTLTPAIAQGVGQNQRVGNQVRVTKTVVRGHIAMRPYDASANPRPAPILVKMWLCRYKKLNTAALASTDIATSFFDTGSSVTGMTGNILDMELFPNTDSWEVIQTKTVKVGASSLTTSVPSANATYFDNSSSVVPFEFSCGSRIGLCTFNDTSLDPTNKNMFLIFQPSQADGSGTTNLTPAEISYAYMCEYIDV